MEASLTEQMKIKSFGLTRRDVPVVSVLLITYNHEHYIRRAIEGVFSQDFDGPMELIIGEDCSTDRTREIIESVCQDSPIFVQLLTSQRNVGMHANSSRMLAVARGEYLALLDGDDYWIDSTKIRRQVSHLSKNPELSGVFEGVQIIFENDERIISHHPMPSGGRCSRSDFIAHYPLTTQTLLIRRGAFSSFPEWGVGTHFGDWVIGLEATKHGPIEALPETSARYRVHGGGVSGPLTPELRMKKLVAFYALLHKAQVLSEFNSTTIIKAQLGFIARSFRGVIDSKADLKTLVATFREMRRYPGGLPVRFFIDQLWLLVRSVLVRLRAAGLRGGHGLWSPGL